MAQKLLDIGVVTEVFDPKWISGLFLRPKPLNRFRLIMDLPVSLNKYIPQCHFKMESINSALNILRENDWIVKIDLKNAYYSVTMAEPTIPHPPRGGKGYMFTKTMLQPWPNSENFHKNSETLSRIDSVVKSRNDGLHR